MMDMQRSCAQALSRLSLEGKTQTQDNRPSGPSSKPRGRFDYRKLQGLCIYYAQGKECKNRFCRFRHNGPISQEQRELFKNK